MWIWLYQNKNTFFFVLQFSLPLHKWVCLHYINQYNLNGKILLLKFPLQRNQQLLDSWDRSYFLLCILTRSVNFLKAMDIDVIKIVKNVGWATLYLCRIRLSATINVLKKHLRVRLCICDRRRNSYLSDFQYCDFFWREREESGREMVNNCILSAKESFDLHWYFFRSLMYPGFVSSHIIWLKCAQWSTLRVSDFQSREIGGLLIPVTPPLHQCRVF